MKCWAPSSVFVTNLPASPPDWLQYVSAVSGLASLILSAFAAVVAYRALIWAKKSWREDGPIIKPELQLVHEMVPQPGEITGTEEEFSLPPGVKARPFSLRPKLRLMVRNEGRTPRQLDNMILYFKNADSSFLHPWYMGLNLNVPAKGTAIREIEAEQLFVFWALCGIEEVSEVYGEIDGAMSGRTEEWRVDLSNGEVAELNVLVSNLRNQN